MTKTLIAASLLALALPLTAMAGPIESACLKSDRKVANRALCGCIQQVADMTLKGGDQRQAAKFFRDPDQAQKVRMSKSGVLRRLKRFSFGLMRLTKFSRRQA